MKITKKNRGFTLIELMIVVAIIGILAAIAVPRFADLIRKSNEGAAKGSLGAVRSAITIYYGEMEGIYISSSGGNTGAQNLTLGGGPFLTKYIDQVPALKLGLPPIVGHTGAKDTNSFVAADADADGSAGNKGEWMYNTSDGLFIVGCTHTDTKTVVISTW